MGFAAISAAQILVYYGFPHIRCSYTTRQIKLITVLFVRGQTWIMVTDVKENWVMLDITCRSSDYL